LVLKARRSGSEMIINENYNKNQWEEKLKHLTCHVLSVMTSQVSPPAILSKILDEEDSSKAASSFIDMKQILLSMIATFSYEKVLMEKTKAILISDLNDQLGQLAGTAIRSLAPLDDACSLTGRPWASVGESDSIVVFQCGHAYLTSALTAAYGRADSAWGSFRCCICCASSAEEYQEETRVLRGRTRRVSNYFSWCPQDNPHPPVPPSPVRTLSSGLFGAESAPRSDGHLDAAQVAALHNWKDIYRTSDWVKTGQRRDNKRFEKESKPETNIFRKDGFALKLKPPPVPPTD